MSQPPSDPHALTRAVFSGGSTFVFAAHFVDLSGLPSGRMLLETFRVLRIGPATLSVRTEPRRVNS